MRVLVFLAAALCAAAQTPDCRLVPGWTQQGPARSYEADTLFEYMDGNAEGYLIYRFVKMQGVTCRSGEDTIVFDISEMADPEYAYGIFCATRDPKLPIEKIGMAAQIHPRKGVLVKDKYYVELAVNLENDLSATLRAFITALEKRIPGRTALPEVIGWFPADKLAVESVRLVPESVLGLRVLPRGYIAQYDYGKAFIVPEDSPEAAAQVMTKLRARVGETQPAKLAEEAFQANDKYLGRLCFFRKGRYIGGYAGLAEGQDALAPASALAARVP
jgi:hypothetical protein